MAFFKRLDHVGTAQRQADVVEAVQQAIFAEGIDLERIAGAALRGDDDLLVQVDHQTITGNGPDFVEQVIDTALPVRTIGSKPFL